ncbi:MAG: S24/S26 family peptidase [Clostridia bacterium]|nr:S24/S26 family peptidase [Clostridia bacterium]
MNSIAEELEKTGRVAYTNQGVSMRPLIRAGRDVWVIEKRSPEDIQKYDVVLFRRPPENGRGVYVLHRVLKRFPDGRFWIVGDNCVSGEDVRPQDVLGVMTQLKRAGKAVDFTSLWYRAYVKLWCAPWRMRFAVLRCKHFAYRVLSGIKRRVFRR